MPGPRRATRRARARRSLPVAPRSAELPPHLRRPPLARLDPRAVLQPQHEHAVLGAVALDRAHVDERPAVDAYELALGEPFFQLLERVVDQVLLALGAREHEPV